MMDINTFRRTADVYGGDLSRWPKELLAAAVGTLKQHDQAQRILDDALILDLQFATLTASPADAALRARILAIPDQFAVPVSVQWLLKPTRLAASIALCSFLGLMLGANDMRDTSYEPRNASAWVLAPEQSMAY